MDVEERALFVLALLLMPFIIWNRDGSEHQSCQSAVGPERDRRQRADLGYRGDLCLRSEAGIAVTTWRSWSRHLRTFALEAVNVRIIRSKRALNAKQR